MTTAKVKSDQKDFREGSGSFWKVSGNKGHITIIFIKWSLDFIESLSMVVYIQEIFITPSAYPVFTEPK